MNQRVKWATRQGHFTNDYYPSWIKTGEDIIHYGEVVSFVTMTDTYGIVIEDGVDYYQTIHLSELIIVMP